MTIFFELFSHDPHIIDIKSGNALFREGEEGHLMYVLTEGTAKVLVNNRVVEMLHHGSVVGEMGMVTEAPRSATVIAVTDCRFVAVDEKRFQFLVQQAPYFATQVMRIMADRLRHTNEMLQPIEEI